MENRMNVPEEYEPVLPGKVKAHIEKEERQPQQQEGQTIWYQCVDMTENFGRKVGIKAASRTTHFHC